MAEIRDGRNGTFSSFKENSYVEDHHVELNPPTKFFEMNTSNMDQLMRNSYGSVPYKDMIKRQSISAVQQR